MEDKTVPWWSPAGVEMRPRPTEYQDEPTEIVSSDEWMGKAGYLNLVTIGDRYCMDTDMAVTVWAFGDSGSASHHLVVSLMGTDYELAEFFVGRESALAFWLEKLPSLVTMIRDSSLADNVRQIRNAIIAYVRHGEGKRTIDELGETSLDEAERSRERLAARRAREAKASAA